MGTLGYAMLQVTRAAALDTTALDTATPGTGRARRSDGLALALAGWMARAITGLARLAGEGAGRLRRCGPARP